MVSESIQNTEWYHYNPKHFDLFNDFNHVQAYCGDPADNMICYQDALNWSIMNKSELTADIYKFITHRINVIREGFQYNFLPKHIDLHALIELIDWHFILDCISWFL